VTNSTDDISVPNKEINLEVNSEKISCLLSRMQNNIGSLENVTNSSNTLGTTTLIHQDYMLGKVNSRFK
jgi:hypothetical protein